jgi:hypothetical protein
MIPEHNFISSNALETDKDLFFGPLEETDKFIVIQPEWIMAHLVAGAGIFKSVGDAKRNGWNKPIPNGWSSFTIGKLKHKLFILNAIDFPN